VQRPPQIQPRERRGDRTRTRIAEAAFEEFRSAGVDRASISRIAERAGVSRPSFYFHFPTKEHVLLELQLSFEAPLASRLRGSAGLREALDCLVVGVLEAQESVGDPDLFSDMLRIHTRRNDDLPLNDRQLVFDALLECFVEGSERQELRRGLEPDGAARLCLSCVFGYLILNRESPAERRSELASMVSLYLDDDREDGLSEPRGAS
jgi:AcrR family transcriptional regulator